MVKLGVDRMKKNEIFILLAFISSFCFAKPAPEPEWFRNYKKSYPNLEYIAQRGSGKTAEDAKTDAASQLARYFQSTGSTKATAQALSRAGFAYVQAAELGQKVITPKKEKANAQAAASNAEVAKAAVEAKKLDAKEAMDFADFLM